MKKKYLIYHLTFWIVFTLVFTILSAGHKNVVCKAFISELVNLPMRLIVAYLNLLLLLPLLIQYQKKIQYFIYTTASLIFCGSIQRIISYHASNYIYPNILDYGLWLPYKFLQSILSTGIPMITMIGIISVIHYAELKKEAQLLMKEKIESELKYLKAQINPHFLFNSLNNIYSLSLQKSHKASELILKLSEVLSFSIYQSKNRFIPLTKEISLITDYIDLEKSRFEDRVDVSFDTPLIRNNINIPPLIFLPFVENAFKHSLRNELNEAKIAISLNITNSQITFSVKNTKPDFQPDNFEISEYSGIGLENIRKRLNIIYKNLYKLDIDDQEKYFHSTLTLDVN